MEEVFKNIDGYSFYQISNFGRVKSLFLGKERFNAILPNHKNKYMTVWFCENKIRKAYLVHRLVAKAFIPNPNNLPQVNHINGIKSDNRVENLEWCDQSHNMIHAFKIGIAKSLSGTESKAATRVGKYLGGKLIKSYSLIKDAKDDGFIIAGIYQSISTGCKHYGYNWQYLDKKKKDKIRKNPKPICSYIDGQVIKIYNRHSELRNDGYWLGNIYRCLKNPELKYKKLYWKYA